MRAARLFICLLLPLALVACGKPLEGGEPPIEAAPPTAEPIAPEPPAEEPTAAEPDEPLEEPADDEPTEDEENPPPVTTSADLRGTVLTPKQGVQILLPDGWDEEPADDGSLLRMVRDQAVGSVKVNVTLDYNVDESLPEGVTLAGLRDDIVEGLPEQLSEEQWKTVSEAPVTVAGYPALAVTGDLTAEGQPCRAKLFIVVQGETFYTLSGIGPRDEFTAVVEPEIDAIAASLKLP